MSNKQKTFLIVMLLLFITVSLVTIKNNDIEDKVNKYISNLSEPFSGTILLAIGDDILLNKGYGMANYSYDIPNTADTKFLIGSATKHFTAILILQMVEKGLINLDDSIEKYFPDGPKEKTSKITIRHLLLHQSGIPQCYSGFKDYLTVHSKLFHTHKEYLRLIWNSEFRHEPGKGSTYSTPGYYLLGIILEKVSNKSYAELLKENILKPLKMENTFVDNNLSIHKNMATGYQKGINGLVLARKNEQSNHFAAGDLISTSKDLYLFQRCLNYKSDRLMSPRYMKLLLEAQDQGGAFIGSKYKQFYHDNKRYLEIMGLGTSTSFGFRNRMTRFINEDACCIVMSNIETDNTMSNEMFAFLSDILLEKLDIDFRFTKNKKKIDDYHAFKLPEESQKEYTGLYREDNNTYFNVFDKKDTLNLHSISYKLGSYNMKEEILIPIDTNKFIGSENNMIYCFNRDNYSDDFKISVISNDDTLFVGEKAESSNSSDLVQYAGNYYSLELQKTVKVKFESKNNQLVCEKFLNSNDTFFIQLNKDVFCCDYGLLIFKRYENNDVKNFRLQNNQIDSYEGVSVGLFIKK